MPVSLASNARENTAKTLESSFLIRESRSSEFPLEKPSKHVSIAPKTAYFVPYIRSPASPSPGTI